MTSKLITALSFATLVSAQSVAAQAVHHQGQQRPDSARMMPGPMMGPMCMGMGASAGMMLGGPASILRAADVLALTNQQKTRLQAIQARHAQTVAPYQQQARAARQKLAGLLNPERPDLAAYEAALKEAMTPMIAVRLSAARATVEARGVLTAQQRVKLAEAKDLMPEMTCPAHGRLQHGRK